MKEKTTNPHRKFTILYTKKWISYKDKWMTGGHSKFFYFNNQSWLPCNREDHDYISLTSKESMQSSDNYEKPALYEAFLLPIPWKTPKSESCVSLKSFYGWLLRKLPDFSYCDEFSFEPAVIFQSFINTNFLSLQFHLSMVDIWILGWGMVSPDNDILYILRSHTKFKSNLVT